MKREIILFIALIVILTGCNGKTAAGTKNNKANAVDEVLKQGAGQNDKTAKADTKEKTYVNKISYKDSDIDIDLTKLNSTMVYSTVNDMMNNYNNYIGKVIRVKGFFSPVYYEPTKQYYYSVIVPDATACCANGLEFIWEDGMHIFPDEYPDEGEEIVVTGNIHHPSPITHHLRHHWRK